MKLFRQELWNLVDMKIIASIWSHILSSITIDQNKSYLFLIIPVNREVIVFWFGQGSTNTCILKQFIVLACFEETFKIDFLQKMHVFLSLKLILFFKFFFVKRNVFSNSQ